LEQFYKLIISTFGILEYKVKIIWWLYFRVFSGDFRPFFRSSIPTIQYLICYTYDIDGHYPMYVPIPICVTYVKITFDARLIILYYSIKPTRVYSTYPAPDRFFIVRACLISTAGKANIEVYVQEGNRTKQMDIPPTSVARSGEKGKNRTWLTDVQRPEINLKPWLFEIINNITIIYVWL